MSTGKSKTKRRKKPLPRHPRYGCSLSYEVGKRLLRLAAMRREKPTEVLEDLVNDAADIAKLPRYVREGRKPPAASSLTATPMTTSPARSDQGEESKHG